MSNAEPNAIPIEQLTTDQHTRVHNPPYKTGLLALEKNCLNECTCLKSGDWDSTFIECKILCNHFIRKNVLHILINTQRIADKLGSGEATGETNNTFSKQLVMDGLYVIKLDMTGMRVISGKAMIVDIIAVIHIPEECEGSEENRIEEGRMCKRS